MSLKEILNSLTIKMQRNDFIKVIAQQKSTSPVSKGEIVYMKLISDAFVARYSSGKVVKYDKKRGREIIEQLINQNYLEINRETLINKYHIKKIDNLQRKVIMECETELRVSRRKWHTIKGLEIQSL